jgi:rhomboid protease GluP
MKNLEQKFQLLFKPFLLIGLYFISGYTFLHWLLTIKTNTISWDEDVVHMYAPAILLLPILLIKFWEISKIIQTSNTKSPLGGLVLLPFFTIMAANAIAQFYLVSSTGVLTIIDNIDKIDSLPPTKYYELKRYYLDSLLVKTKYTATVSRKGRELYLDIYAACPIYATNTHKNIAQVTTVTKIGIIHSEKNILRTKAINSLNIQKGDSTIEPPPEIQLPQPKAWFCKSYRKTISNHLSLNEEKALKHEFYQNTIADFKLQTSLPFTYLDQIGLTREYYKYNEAIETATELKNNAATIILVPKFEPFDERNGNKLFWIFCVFAIGAVIHFIVLLFFKFNEGKLEKYLANRKRDI